MEQEVMLSIIIPAYNEAQRIGATLVSIVNYLKRQNFNYEIIVVDDGSTDDTASIVQKFVKVNKQIFLICNQVNRGKGYAVRKGMLKAKGKFILFSDADLSTPFGEVEKLILWLKNGCDVAIGSRALKESQIEFHQPRYREWGGKLFNKVVRVIAVRGIKDTQCGFKCFTNEVANRIFPKQCLEGFGFDIEILYITKKLGFKVKEVPVRWRHSPESKMNLLKDSLDMLKSLFQIRINDLRGLYKER